MLGVATRNECLDHRMMSPLKRKLLSNTSVHRRKVFVQRGKRFPKKKKKNVGTARAVALKHRHLDPNGTRHMNGPCNAYRGYHNVTALKAPERPEPLTCG